MKELELKALKRYKDFLVVEGEKSNVIFSTAENNRSFNRHTEDGIKELESLIEDFRVEKVIYLKQIHSDNVLVYSKNDLDFNENEGDSIITKEKNVIIGAFTADCVPVIIKDETKGVIAAIHSGWKGTYNSITKKTIEKMVNDFDVNVKNLKVYIGPHIRKCCYEVSEDLKEKFLEKTQINEEILFDGRKLNMEACIEKDLIEAGVSDDNVFTMAMCTHCEEEIKLHSYRKSVGTYGRLFSFVYNK